MKKILPPLLTLMAVGLGGCSVIGGIFKAGAYTGIIAVVVVLVIIGIIVAMFRKK
jgi:hypothetical protein